MDIEIRIHRPIVLLLIIAGVIGGVYWLTSAVEAQPAATAMGGSGETQTQQAISAEDSVRTLREQQAVLDRREGILRAQLNELLQEREDVGSSDPELAAQITDATNVLVGLLSDRTKADDALKSSLQELWDAEGSAMTASRTKTSQQGTVTAAMVWPVQPKLGISATFHDPSYKQRFGMEHNAIDIPVDQGSDVHAAADGIVVKVSDQGMGFNSLVIQHADGYATLYGHVIKFLVSEGQHVTAGQVVALSGGRPGTPGAGAFTTGPHLHFEVHQNGTPVDPLQFLDKSELPSQ